MAPPVAFDLSHEEDMRLNVIAAVAVLVCATSLLAACRRACGHVRRHRRDCPSSAATLRDPANDVRGQATSTSRSIAVGEAERRSLVVRFDRAPPDHRATRVTRASVKAGAGSWALVARRSAGDLRGLLPALQPRDRDDNDRRGHDRRPYRDDPGSDLGPGRAGERHARPRPGLLPRPSRSAAGVAPRHRAGQLRAGDLVLPHRSSPEARNRGPCIWPGQVR